MARGPDEQVREHMREFRMRRGIKEPAEVPSLGPNGYASGVASEGETLVTFRAWRYQWQEVEIEERFSISEDKRGLRYSLQIQGPKGKKDSFEMEFECP
jgi:hypothetical protein